MKVYEDEKHKSSEDDFRDKYICQHYLFRYVDLRKGMSYLMKWMG